MNSRNRQSGLTLIELLITIALAAALVGAAVQFALSSRQLGEVAKDNSYTSHNGRLALNLLNRDLRMAGYRDVESDALPDPLLRTACGSFDPCTANSDDASDRIAVIYEPRSDDITTRRDCAGSVIAADANGKNQLIANSYYVQVEDQISTLFCRSFNIAISVDGVTTATARGAAIGLIDGVDDMQLLYGVASEAETIRFVNSADVTDWSLVQAVRFSVLVSSGMSRSVRPDKVKNYALLDSTSKNYGDGEARQIYTSTISLRNNIL